MRMNYALVCSLISVTILATNSVALQCSEDNPCNSSCVGPSECDCDNNEQCAGLLVCVADAATGLLSGGDHPDFCGVDRGTQCSKDDPCDASCTTGVNCDCDKDDECAGGLVCVADEQTGLLTGGGGHIDYCKESDDGPSFQMGSGGGNNKASDDCNAVANTCQEFFGCCEAGCKGGYSSSCGYAGTCECGQEWAGRTAPKVQQSLGEWREDAYFTHNSYRYFHSANNLEADGQLEDFAQSYAELLARNDEGMIHSKDTGYGENLFLSSGGVNEGKDAVTAWYDEVTNPGYNFNRPGFDKGTGHFTQVVWGGSQQIGCGRAIASSGAVYVSCNYYPPGNWKNKFEENVYPSWNN